jgi:uncharacterized protein (TIGR02001 family)
MALRETLPVTRNFGTLLLVCLAGCAVARADEVRAPGTKIVTGSLGGTSDFVFRGLSLTRGKPAAQASLDVEFPREFYVGGFVANADPNPGPSPALEVDVWAGRYWRLAENYSLDLRLSQYTYPDDPRRVSYNRSELTGTVGFHNRVFIAAIYSPNTRAVGSSPGYKDEGAWALEVSTRHAFNERFALSAGAGHYGLEGVYDASYNYWNATLTATFRPFELQLAYLGSDPPEGLFLDSTDGDRVAVTALWRFSSSP